MAKPQPKADVDPNFERQLKSLQSQNATLSEKVLTGDRSQWLTPDRADWPGDVFDWDAMSEPFDRSKSNQAFADATKDPRNPGTTGDLTVTQTQADYLAVMERAFRARHTMRRPRAVAHAMGRRRGHGSDNGPLVQCALEYVRGLVKESKGGGQ